MALELVTPPAALPVSLAEAKAWCRLEEDDNSFDVVLTGSIRAATAWVEQYCGISIMERTWRLWLDRFSDSIELARGPVISVSSVKYVDGDGLAQTLSSSAYALDLVSRPQWLVRVSDASWPATLDTVNAVYVDYVAGYQELPATHEDLKIAIQMLVANWFANPEAVNVGNITSEMPFGVQSLVSPYRRIVI